jgi:HMG (high mobility group) box
LHICYKRPRHTGCHFYYRKYRLYCSNVLLGTYWLFFFYISSYCVTGYRHLVQTRLLFMFVTIYDTVPVKSVIVVIVIAKRTDTGHRTSQSKSVMSATNNNEEASLPRLREQHGQQRAEIGVLDFGISNTNLALQLSLESMRNSQHATRQNFNLGHDRSNDIMNNFGTSLVQQYLQRQQRQHILEQNLLAQRLEQLRHIQPSIQFSHEIPGLNQVIGTDPYSFAPSIQASNILPQSILPFQLPNNLSPQENSTLPQNFLPFQRPNNLSAQDNLLDMFMATTFDRSFPTQSDQVGSASLAILNLHDSSSFLCDSSLRHIQQLPLPSEIVPNSSIFAAEQYIAAVAPLVSSTTDNEVVPSSMHRERNEQAPIRALSAYNFFFRYERERILNSEGNGNDFDLDVSQKHQEAMLKSHWNRDRTVKRRHRKSHGKISFSELSKKISQRWNELPKHQKKFFNEVAAKDWERYHREIEQQKRKQS